MSAAAPRTRRRTLRPAVTRGIWVVVVLALIAAMALSTKIVAKDSSEARSAGSFSAADYGKTEFPKLKAYIQKNAVPAATLAAALTADASAASKKYGQTVDQATYVVAVSFTGVVGQIPAAGYTPITQVQGLPAGVNIGLQLGPAVNGTDLRDVTGKITLDDFENQIQYQNAGQAINDQLKVQLKKIDASSLTGKTIHVDGAFTIVNPAQWNVTPASITVEQ